MKTRNRLLVVAAVLVVAGAVVLTQRSDRSPEPPPAASTSSLLVLTWAPSLCEVETSASGCRSGAVGRRGDSLLLHGLWPQPREQQYCGVPPRSRDRRSLDLPDDLRTRLNLLMSDAAVLAPHEWYAHGTCSGLEPDEYFAIATALADEAIAVLDPVFDRASGRGLASRSVREAVDARFGEGAGNRVNLACRNARNGAAVVFEVRMSLPAAASLGPLSLAEALAEGPAVPPGCGRGRLP